MTAKVIKEVIDKNIGIGDFYLLEKEYDEITGTRRHTYCSFDEFYDTHRRQIDFNPSKYKLFDGKVMTYLDDLSMNEPIWQPNHKFYDDYAVIRKNIAILRQGLYTMYFPEGEYDADLNEKEIQALSDIGLELGGILKRESLARSLTSFASSMPPAERRMGDYGVEHIGVAAMYKALLLEQNKFTWNPLRWIQGKFHSYDWDLPPIEETPFRKQDINEALFQEQHKLDLGMDQAVVRMATEALMIQRMAVELLNPAALKAGDAEQSVELAHHILDVLKNMKFEDSDPNHYTLDDQKRDLEKGELLAELAMTYQNVIADLAAHNPEALQDPRFEAARLALGRLGHLTLIDSQEASCIENDGASLHMLTAAQHELPQEFQIIAPGQERSLLHDVEQALIVATQYRGVRQGMANRSTDAMQHTVSGASAYISAANARGVEAMQQTISGVSAYFASSSENILKEAKAINQTNQMLSGNRPKARILPIQQKSSAAEQFRA